MVGGSEPCAGPGAVGGALQETGLPQFPSSGRAPALSAAQAAAAGAGRQEGRREGRGLGHVLKETGNQKRGTGACAGVQAWASWCTQHP